MPDSFFSLAQDEQADIINGAAPMLGRRAALLEQDIWICWVLDVLFSIPDHHPMAFKGGTSLSKVYGIIDRFSQDVDISLDYRFFGDGYDPFGEGSTGKQTKRLAERLKSHVKAYANDVVVPALRNKASKLMPSGNFDIKIDESGEEVRFFFPQVIADREGYLGEDVLIELGGRNIIDPNEKHEVAPYLAEVATNLEFPKPEVTVLSPLKTFWEKATLIHVECSKEPFREDPNRYSRHWFDLARLAQHDTTKSAISNRELLETVVSHKQVFFRCKQPNYADCLAGGLRLVPNDDGLRGLEEDFRNMKSTGMLNDDAPEFGELMEQIRGIETAINTWP